MAGCAGSKCRDITAILGRSTRLPGKESLFVIVAIGLGCSFWDVHRFPSSREYSLDACQVPLLCFERVC